MTVFEVMIRYGTDVEDRIKIYDRRGNLLFDDSYIFCRVWLDNSEIERFVKKADITYIYLK